MVNAPKQIGDVVLCSKVGVGSCEWDLGWTFSKR